MKIEVLGWDNKKVGDIELNDSVFGAPLRSDILQRVVEWQRAKKQAGTHNTKIRGEVAGRHKKPFAQKGTGRARQGSLRGPHQRGGAVSHGPRVRSHATSLTKKFRKLGLKTALSAKFSDGNLCVIKDANLKSPKSKDLALSLKNLGVLDSALIIDETINENLGKAVYNIKNVDALPIIGANVFDILKHKKLVLTESAVKKLEERLA
mgnify:CR=1 FL=1